MYIFAYENWAFQYTDTHARPTYSRQTILQIQITFDKRMRNTWNHIGSACKSGHTQTHAESAHTLRLRRWVSRCRVDRDFQSMAEPSSSCIYTLLKIIQTQEIDSNTFFSRSFLSKFFQPQKIVFLTQWLKWLCLWVQSTGSAVLYLNLNIFVQIFTQTGFLS